MAITNMRSFDLKGNKLSFANWISNISPTETPFTSMLGKEAISQTKFQWQTDIIPAIKADNARIEGYVPSDEVIAGTEVLENVTQIFRRGASVTDTANVVSYYGRGKEIGYQMEKASLELKRDMEKAFLNQGTAVTAATGTAGKTAGFLGLVAAKNATAPDTLAVVHKETAANTGPTEAELFDLTYELYIANSKANIIMFHPKHASFFSGLIEVKTADVAAKGNRMKMFGNMDATFNAEVDTIIDPLGQKFALVPNRLMPENYLYFFNPSDWTEMVLRAPKKIELGRKGSLTEWVIEAEVGLRHRNKFASGILEVKNP